MGTDPQTGKQCVKSNADRTVGTGQNDGRSAIRCNELGDDELGCSVNTQKKIELALRRLTSRQCRCSPAGGVTLVLLAPELAILDVRLGRDPLWLLAPMQRRARQMRGRWLWGIEAIVQRQERAAPKNGRLPLLRLLSKPSSAVPPARFSYPRQPFLSPLLHRLGVDAQSLALLHERSLRSLYCCSDGVRSRGASVTNLSHNASFHSCERITPSNRGIKRLGSKVSNHSYAGWHWAVKGAQLGAGLRQRHVTRNDRCNVNPPGLDHGQQRWIAPTRHAARAK